jgi:CO/xanthine dehydrogenase FAD-binding subunit
MLALNARFGLRSIRGLRSVSADDFFTGLFSTAIEPGELLTEITVPKAGRRTGFAFQEISRRHGDFALVGVAASVTLDEAGNCSGARIALLSVGDRPMLAEQAAKALAGQTPSADAIRASANAAASADIDPSSDIHASAKYRRQLAGVLTRRALTVAFERAAH